MYYAMLNDHYHMPMSINCNHKYHYKCTNVPTVYADQM